MSKTTFLASSCLLLFATQASGEVTVFGPTPYRSAAESPFAKYLAGSNFYLEDFEDGELNTPGISQLSSVRPTQTPVFGTVETPGPLTDSVDGDDGLLDGSGVAGHSLRSHVVGTFLTNPVTVAMDLKFGFEEDELSRLPNAFGFVWTDNPTSLTAINGNVVIRVQAIGIDGQIVADFQEGQETGTGPI